MDLKLKDLMKTALVAGALTTVAIDMTPNSWAMSSSNKDDTEKGADNSCGKGDCGKEKMEQSKGAQGSCGESSCGGENSESSSESEGGEGE
ncbi:MAG: hypothetical protein H6621_10015 [Halobacteriovoraceae bacterium]|nr:hypothetical protein [Halobacteriovoraceae bacterium]MCB9095392.1 hypothetical protein [Halobacteriovoraceae bacterium]